VEIVPTKAIMSKKDIYEDREREESDSSNDLTPVLAGICLNLFEHAFSEAFSRGLSHTR